jgi:hypothetical protein
VRPADHVFRRAALEHHAGPRTKAAAAEIPRPPVALSVCILGALLIASVAALLYLQVPEYASGSLIVGPGHTLFLAVPAELERRLRPGQAVLIPAPSGVAPRATVVRIGETMPSARVGAFLHLDLAHGLTPGGQVTLAELGRAGAEPAAPLLDTVGAVFPARVEVGRESVLSRARG